MISVYTVTIYKVCVRVEDVSTGESPGGCHGFPANGADLFSSRQLLLLHQSEPGGPGGRGNFIILGGQQGSTSLKFMRLLNQTYGIMLSSSLLY